MKKQICGNDPCSTNGDLMITCIGQKDVYQDNTRGRYTIDQGVVDVWKFPYGSEDVYFMKIQQIGDAYAIKHDKAWTLHTVSGDAVPLEDPSGHTFFVCDFIAFLGAVFCIRQVGRAAYILYDTNSKALITLQNMSGGSFTYIHAYVRDLDHMIGVRLGLLSKYAIYHKGTTDPIIWTGFAGQSFCVCEDCMIRNGAIHLQYHGIWAIYDPHTYREICE